MEPLPYYKWYFRDYRANRKVQRLSYIARGLYRELLDEQWDKGYIPDDLEELADICGCPKQVLEAEWQMLSKCFEELEPGKLVNRRLERERTENDKKRVNLSLAGKKGGIGKQKLAKADKCQADANESHIAEQSKAEQEQSSDSPSDESRSSKVEQGSSRDSGFPDSESDFDTHEWCLKTLKAYPRFDQNCVIPPPVHAELYRQLIEREAPARGGELAAAEWFLGVVKEYAASDDVARGFVKGLEGFLKGAYLEKRKASSDAPVDGEGEGDWLTDPDSGEKVWMPKRSA